MKWPRWLRARSTWAGAGALLGLLLGVVLFAPAAWLAGAVADASGGALLLADARGTIWQGSALVVLAGGKGATQAAALPGRLSWKLRPRSSGFELRARQACCLSGEQRLRIAAGIGSFSVRLLGGEAPGGAPVAQVPASWLTGLGAPWNTLQLGGLLRLSSNGMGFASTQGRWAFSGSAELRVDSLSSRASSLESLGDYRVLIDGQPQAAGSATLALSTLRGPLQLNGTGQWGGTTALRFRGEARADAGSEGTLNNLLNVIGRRQGAISILSIG